MSNAKEVAWDTQVTVRLKAVTCCNCGMAFAISEDWNDRRLRDHEWFYCPAGHQQHYTGETEAQRLKRQLDWKTEELERERQDSARKERQLSAARGRITKIKNRVGRGVCPCCNRTFENLGRHMSGKHPEFIGQEVG